MSDFVDTFNQVSPWTPPQALPQCIGPGTCSVIGRSLSVALDDSGGTLAGSANMIAFVNNFPMNAIPWGQTWYYTMDNASSTAPDGWDPTNPSSSLAGTAAGWINGRSSQLQQWYSPGDLEVADDAACQRTDVWMPTDVLYMVLAVGFTVPGGIDISIEGCTFQVPSGSTGCVNGYVLEIPLPDPSWTGSPDYVYEYDFGLVGTLDTSTSVYPDLAAFALHRTPNPATGDTTANTDGSTWNTAQICKAPNKDPFTNATITD